TSSPAGFNSSNSNPAVCPTTTTIYTLTVTDNNGCTDDDQVTITVNPSPTAAAGNDNTICSGTCTTIGGSPAATGGTPGYTYAWTSSPAGFNSSNSNPAVCPTTTTIYTLTVTDNNGCTAQDQVTIKVKVEIEVTLGQEVTIELPDGTKVYVPAGTVSDTVILTITTISEDESDSVQAANQAANSDILRICIPGTTYEITMKRKSDGTPIHQLNGSITITIPYPDADNDGFVDNTGVDETTLRMFYLNENTSRWELISASTVYPNENYVSATVDHLSTFSLLGVFTPPNVAGRVTFAGYQDSDGDWEIFYVDLVDTSDTTPKQVTDNDYDDIDPCISPDGRQVVYAAKKTDKFGIYLRNITGSATETTLCASVEKAAQPAFSTNDDADTWIVFSAIPSGESDWEIYKVRTDGSGLDRLTNDGYNNQAPSHNGTYIVFQSNRGTNNNWEIMRMDMDGNGLTNLTNNDAYDMDPAITSAGDTITFTSDRNNPGDTTNIYVRRPDGSIVQVTSHASTQVSSYFVGDNGDWVVFISNHETSKGNAYVNYANGTNMATPGSWATCVNKSGLEYMEIQSPSWAYIASPDTPTITAMSFQCEAADSGVKLTWSRGSPDDSEDTFEIQRESTSSPWALVGSTSETAFLDTTAVNFRGDTVQYRVRGWNIADSSPWAYSNTLFINWTNLWVQVAGGDTVAQGTQFRADIMSDTVYYMDTLHACLTYDTNCFATPTVQLGDATDTSVHPGTNLMVDMDTTTGTIEFLVNMLDVNSWVTTTSDTSLVEIYLWAIGDTGTCCTLDLRRTDCATLSDSPTMGNTAAQEICVMDVSDTTICISSQPFPTPTLRGDVNCDGKVNIVDITKLERCLLGLDSDCYCNWANADANQDGKVSSADITAVERIILGLPTAPAPTKITTPEVIAKLKMRGVAARELTLFVGEVKGFDTLQCDLGYDPARVKIERVEAGSLTEGAYIRSNIQNEQGRIRILLNMPGIAGINGSGDLLKITLAEAASAGDISTSKIVLGSNQAIELPFELLNPEAIPTRSFLSQNYPNPLNPGAWIPFGLSRSTKVVINIYSLSGQLIRTIDLGEKSVGIYEDKEKAAYWDGKDKEGHKAASGVYLYQLKAGDFTSTRKMIVVK
ncbi:MAG: dockerin type I domain-containing protein, partial [Thermodesulfobacteriota bacterium]|nr:dockerin type I domain-containing protein [Thermodesulfobacteriota bacterium]